MKKIVDILQKINDEVQNPTGSEERRYCILDPKSALEKVNSLIASSKSSINAILDVWGLRLISQCKTSLLRAINNRIKIRLIVANQCIGNESLLTLPEGIHLKIGDVFSNTIIIDTNSMISIDSSNGKAALFTSIDIFGLSQLRNFEEGWNNAIEINNPVNTDPDIIANAIQLTKAIEDGLSSHLFVHFINPGNDSPGIFVKSMEKCGIKISDNHVHKVLNIIDLALRMQFSGSLKHDKSSNTIIIQSKPESKPVLPWAVLLTLYLKYIGNESKIIQSSKQGSCAQIIHIKLSKPIP
jgi:hypothetical protein